MLRGSLKDISWDFFSKLIILCYLVFQVTRWPILPQFMDMHYHLLTAWGFIQAGGYSGWDFWQYAPIGRIHIYPPFFHIVLAFFLKLGVSSIILAKIFEAATPVLFLVVLWQFMRRNFGNRLAFFSIILCSSSFSFHLSLINHVPATCALIFGLLALDQLLQNKPSRCLLLLTLSFYTHIGVSWFIFFSILFFGLFCRPYRKMCIVVILSAFVLSAPILYKQFVGMKFITAIGLSLNEKYNCQIKLVDYLLASAGFFFVFSREKKYRLFAALFLASLIFLSYPYRFFSGEGFLPVILLSAFALYVLYGSVRNNKIYRIGFFLIIILMLLVSPTLSLSRDNLSQPVKKRINFFDSAFFGMLLARGESTWFPEQYFSAVTMIKDNSEKDDIIYATLDNVGVTLAQMSGRATVNALFPEIKPAVAMNPILPAKIVIFTKDDDPSMCQKVIHYYQLVKIGENKLFILYKNPLCLTKVNVKRAGVSFSVIIYLIAAFIFLFLKGKSLARKITLL